MELQPLHLFWGRHYSLLCCWEKAAKGELTWDVTLMLFAPAAPAG